MSTYMTQEEIDAEQELIRTQDERIAKQDAATAEALAALGSLTDAGISDEAADAVTPADLLNSANYTDRATRNERFDTCKGCDRLFKPTRTCRECGCFMALKTWLSDATCPVGKW